MSVNVQLKDKLQRISGESITSAKILSALGYTPARDTDLTSHKNDSTIHITSSERATWNNKVDSTYVQNAIANKANKDELFNGDYNDLINKPIENTSDGILYIADEQGNVVARIDSEGLHTVGVDIHGQDVALKNDLNNYYTIDQVNEKINNDTFSGDYNDLTNKPIENTEDGILYIADPEGNIIARIDENGIETHQLTAKKILLNGVDLDTALNSKAEQSYVTTELGKKADTTYVDGQLNLKANKDELFSGDYNDLTNKPIENTENGTLQIADEYGNVIMKVDSEGVTTHDVKIHSGENIVSVKELINESIEGVRPVAGDHIEIGADKSINVIIESVDEKDDSHPASKNYVDKKVADLVDGAPEALDTLKELGDALSEHEDAYDALLETVGKKADRTELPTVSAGDNISVTKSGTDNKVSLNSEIAISSIESEEANITSKLLANELEASKLTTDNLMDKSGELSVTDESGNITFKVDNTGVTTIANLQVGKEGSIQSIEDLISGDISTSLENYYTSDEVDDLLDQKQPKFNDGTSVDLTASETVDVIRQENGTVTVTKQNIQIGIDQVTNLSNTLNNKQPKFDDGGSTNADAGKTVALITQTGGKVEATYQDIKITKDQVTDFVDTVTTVKGSTNIDISNTGHDYTVSLKDSIQVADINTETLVAETANVTKLQVHESITAPQFIQESNSLQVTDESGNISFEVDSTGKTSVAELYVRTSDPAADNIVTENILDLIKESSESSIDSLNVDAISVGQGKTISTISQEKGKIKVETVDINIEQSQVKDLDTALSGKQPKFTDGSSTNSSQGKTISKITQSGGTVSAEYQDISIAQSQVQGLGDTINSIPKTTVSKGSYINVTPTTTGNTTDYKVELGDDIYATSVETDSLVVNGLGSFDNIEAATITTDTISAPQFIQDGESFVIADEDGNKTLEVDKEGKTTIADLHVKIGEEIKHISDVIGDTIGESQENYYTTQEVDELLNEKENKGPTLFSEQIATTLLTFLYASGDQETTLTMTAEEKAFFTEFENRILNNDEKLPGFYLEYGGLITCLQFTLYSYGTLWFNIMEASGETLNGYNLGCDSTRSTITVRKQSAKHARYLLNQHGDAYTLEQIAGVWDELLAGKQNQIQDNSFAGSTSKTPTLIKQTNGAISVEYQPISITTSQISDYEEPTIPEQYITEVAEGKNIRVTESTSGNTTTYTVKVANNLNEIEQIDAIDITTSVLSANEITVKNSLTAPQFIQDGESLQVADESGNVIASIDNSGISTTTLKVKKDGELTDILDLISDSGGSGIDTSDLVAKDEIQYANPDDFWEQNIINQYDIHFLLGNGQDNSKYLIAGQHEDGDGKGAFYYAPVGTNIFEDSGAAYAISKYWELAVKGDLEGYLQAPEEGDASGKWGLLGINGSNTNTCDEIYITDHKLYTQTLIAKTIQIPTSSNSSVTGVGAANQILVTNGNVNNNAYWSSLKTINGTSILGSGNIVISGSEGGSDIIYNAGDGIEIDINNNIHARYIEAQKQSIGGSNYEYYRLKVDGGEPIVEIYNDAQGLETKSLAFASDYYDKDTSDGRYSKYNWLGTSELDKETSEMKGGYFNVVASTQGVVLPRFTYVTNGSETSYGVSLDDHTHSSVPLADNANVANEVKFSELTYQEGDTRYMKLALVGQWAGKDTSIGSSLTSAPMSYIKEWAMTNSGHLHGWRMTLTDDLSVGEDFVFYADATSRVVATENLQVLEGFHLKTNKIYAPTSSAGSTYGYGSSGQVLKSNGSTIYWATDNTGTDNDKKTSSSDDTTTSNLYLIGAKTKSTSGQTTYSRGAYIDGDGDIHTSSGTVVTGESAYHIKALTQAEYDALTSKDATTIYLITA